MPCLPVFKSRRSSRESAVNTTRKFLLLKKKNKKATRIETDVTSFATECSIHESPSYEAPWRVEKILCDGPPCETDWWDNDGDKADEQDVVNDGSILTQQAVSHNASNVKQFRNRGLETWLQVQEAWRSSSGGGDNDMEDDDTTDNDSTIVNKQRRSMVSPTLRRGLVRNLCDHRTLELSERVPLSTLVSAYVNVWHSGDSE